MRAVKMWTRLICKFSRPYHKYDIFSFTHTWNAPRLVRENEGVLRIRSFFSFLYLKASCRQAILNKKKRSSGISNAFWRWFLKSVGCYGPNNVYGLRESLQIWTLRLVKIKAYSGTWSRLKCYLMVPYVDLSRLKSHNILRKFSLSRLKIRRLQCRPKIRWCLKDKESLFRTTSDV